MFLKYVPNGYIDIELDQISAFLRRNQKKWKRDTKKCENNLKTDHEFEHVQLSGSNSTHYATLA